jgi:seryl-tRNA synthetase
MAPKVPPNVISPTKSLESSTMTQEEREEIVHHIGKVEKKMDRVENKTNEVVNKMDENRKEMEKKMDENREHMKNNMLQLQNSMSSMILHALDDRIPK